MVLIYSEYLKKNTLSEEEKPLNILFMVVAGNREHRWRLKITMVKTYFFFSHIEWKNLGLDAQAPLEEFETLVTSTIHLNTILFASLVKT